MKKERHTASGVWPGARVRLGTRASFVSVDNYGLSVLAGRLLIIRGQVHTAR